MSNDEAIRQFRELCEEVYRESDRKREARREAEVVAWPKPLSEMELARRQAIIDQTWERVLEERREAEEEMKRCCHRGPGDPDFGG
jgi:hypothetical protein